MILAARQIVGELEYDLIKIALDGKKLSFLRYPFPCLLGHRVSPWCKDFRAKLNLDFANRHRLQQIHHLGRRFFI